MGEKRKGGERERGDEGRRVRIRLHAKINYYLLQAWQSSAEGTGNGERKRGREETKIRVRDRSDALTDG